MNPELEQRLSRIEEQLTRLEDLYVRMQTTPDFTPDFVASIRNLLVTLLGTLSINDLGDVDITSPSNGQVLKYTTSGDDRWVNGTDDIGAM